MDPVGASPAQAPESPPTVFFDGGCVLCHRSVAFLMRRDRAGRLRFAPLQGETARRLLSPAEIDAGREGTVALHEPGAGRTSVRAAAVLRALGYLPPPWRWLAPLADTPLRRPLDALYRFVARNRARWFGREEACALPDPSMRARLLD